MENIYDNFDEYDPNKKCKILIVFDDMIANMVGDTKINPIVTKLFIWGRKMDFSLVFILFCSTKKILD